MVVLAFPGLVETDGDPIRAGLLDEAGPDVQAIQG